MFPIYIPPQPPALIWKVKDISKLIKFFGRNYPSSLKEGKLLITDLYQLLLQSVLNNMGQGITVPAY